MIGKVLTPSSACSALPDLMIWAATFRTVLIGIAKPIPTLPCQPVFPVEIWEVTPTTRPAASISGPPELPWLIARIRLDRVIDRERVRRLDLALDGADEPARQRPRV